MNKIVQSVERQKKKKKQQQQQQQIGNKDKE